METSKDKAFVVTRVTDDGTHTLFEILKASIGDGAEARAGACIKAAEKTCIDHPRPNQHIKLDVVELDVDPRCR